MNKGVKVLGLLVLVFSLFFLSSVIIKAYPNGVLCIQWKGESSTQCSTAFENFNFTKYKENLEKCYFTNCVENVTFGMDCEKINCSDDMFGMETPIETETPIEVESETEAIEEQPIEEKKEEVTMEELCNLCPSGCQLIHDSSNCGSCVCPPNYGRCYSEGVRYDINNTNVYCLWGILIKQKENNIECQNNFECVSNFCSNGKCYDISSQVKENTSMINKILKWFKRLFHI